MFQYQKLELTSATRYITSLLILKIQSKIGEFYYINFLKET